MRYVLKVFHLLTPIIVIFTALNAVAFIAMGILESIHGLKGIFIEKDHPDERPGLIILESLDVFLVALVFLIFAIGITMLFLPKSADQLRENLPNWMNIKSFIELKLILWEAILTALIVFFVTEVYQDEAHLSWDILLIPGSILILSLSIFVLRKSEHKKR